MDIAAEIWDLILAKVPVQERHRAARVCYLWRALLLRRRRPCARPYDLIPLLRSADFWSLSGATFPLRAVRPLLSYLAAPILKSGSVDLFLLFWPYPQLHWRRLVVYIKSPHMLKFLWGLREELGFPLQYALVAAIHLDDLDCIQMVLEHNGKNKRTVRAALLQCRFCSLDTARYLYANYRTVPSPALFTAAELQTLIREFGLGRKFNINLVRTRGQFLALRPFHASTRADVVGAFAPTVPRGTRWEHIILHHACCTDNLELVVYLAPEPSESMLLNTAISYGAIRVAHWLCERGFRCVYPVLSVSGERVPALAEAVLPAVLETDKPFFLALAERLEPAAAAALLLQDPRAVPHISSYTSRGYWTRVLRHLSPAELHQVAMSPYIRRSRARVLMRLLSPESLADVVAHGCNAVVTEALIAHSGRFRRDIPLTDNSLRGRVLQFELDTKK